MKHTPEIMPERVITPLPLTFQELEPYKFIFTLKPRGSRASEKASYIDRLPTSGLVMDPEEVLSLAQALASPEAMKDAGLTSRDPNNDARFSELSEDMFVYIAQGQPLLTKAGETALGRAIMAGQQAVLMPELIPGTGRRRKAHEKLILQTASDAWEQMVNSNLGLVYHVASKRSGETALEDLIGDGVMGLMRASAKFDYRRGFKFSTYATTWIRQSLQRNPDSQNRPIQLPTNMVKDLTSLQRKMAEYAELNEEAYDEIANHFGYSEDELTRILAIKDMIENGLSLDSTMFEGSDERIIDRVASEESDPGRPLIEVVEQQDIYAAMLLAVERLPDSHRQTFQRIMFAEAVEGPESAAEEVRAIASELQLSPHAINHRVKIARAMLRHPAMGLTQHRVEGEDLTGAACEGEAVTTFFVPTTEIKSKAKEKRESLCGRCAVREACESYAIKHKDELQEGYWGYVKLGLSAERKAKTTARAKAKQNNAA